MGYFSAPTLVEPAPVRPGVWRAVCALLRPTGHKTSSTPRGSIPVIVGIGVDVCNVGRMARELAREGGGFRDQVFTPSEIADCGSRPSPPRHFAARFAAKEAALKALHTGVPDTGAFRQVEVCGGAGATLALRFHGAMAAAARTLGVTRAHVTFAREGPNALANVVLESTAGGTGDGHHT